MILGDYNHIIPATRNELKVFIVNWEWLVWYVTGAPFYNGAAGPTTHKGRPRKRCKIALPECSPPSDGDLFAAPNFGERSTSEIPPFYSLYVHRKHAATCGFYTCIAVDAACIPSLRVGAGGKCEA